MLVAFRDSVRLGPFLIFPLNDTKNDVPLQELGDTKELTKPQPILAEPVVSGYQRTSQQSSFNSKTSLVDSEINPAHTIHLFA